MELTFVGAAREVTGSCHLLRVGNHTVALDCGLFQGRRMEAHEKNLALPLPVDALDAVVLSHAHIDHSGRLPLLAARGFSKTIWATAATRDLCAVMLADSAHIQEQDAEFLERRQRTAVPPLYTMRDAARVSELMVGVPYRKTFDVVPGVRATFVDAGHILGSASVILDCTDAGETRRLVFSGDIGRKGLPIIRDPEPPGGAEILVMESTYGDREHGPIAASRQALARVIGETARRGGRILIPAFAVGRTQELVYDLHALVRAKAIPPIPIFIDSPLATDVTAVFQMHPEILDESEDMVRTVEELFQFPLVRYTRDVEASKALNRMSGPMIIIAASGMAESGRILHHLAHGAGDPRNTILIVGYQAEHTLGRRIVERRDTIKVFGEEIPLRAHVEVLDGYSAHADRSELLDWLDAVRAASPRLEQVYLVHGEPDAQNALAATIGARGCRVSCPAPHTRVAL
ncbi:MAG TPA: MBL fold metallo-hydrolase [Gemmatimonadaceae bacterium]|nr:MBL fold metallo-hydrolase [Gemmatimonadaceae bacterium]